MDITDLIGNYAFPIICCLIMFKQNYDMRNQHEAEMNKFSEALNNNTLALTRLVDKLDERT